MDDKVERVSASGIETLIAMCIAQKVTGTKLGTDWAYDQIVAALSELLAFREGYDPQERLPEPDHQVVVEFTVYKEPAVVDRCLAVFDHEAWQWVGCDGGDPWREPVDWALRWYPIGGE